MSAVVLLILRVLMALALYAFLGLALYLLWRDLQRQGESLSARQVPLLTVLRDQGEAPQVFAKPEIVIGRDAACDCVLDDQTVSARHARLRYHHNQWWIEDSGSTNGTFLNGEAMNIPAVLAHGDRLRCGQVELRIQIGGNNA
ncbi:MAG: FHA domain-containing protein [Anaerolineales bacterium]|nr:FHA domain-containing protein [Anaerolineales bacterium]